MLRNFSRLNWFEINTKNMAIRKLHQSICQGKILLLLAVCLGLQIPLHAARALSSVMVISRTNNERITHGLVRLHRSITLDRAAALKADSMFRSQYFAHVSPQGQHFTDWLGRSNKFKAYAENLANGYRGEQALVSAWMNCATHRLNILNTEYTHIGVSVRTGILQGRETTLVVQLFGEKRIATPLARIARHPS